MSVEEIKRIERKLEEQNKLIQEGFDKWGARVSKLELSEAERKGRESVMVGSSVNWSKVALSLAKSLGVALGLAYLIAQALLK